MSEPCFTIDQILKLVRWSRRTVVVMLNAHNVKHWEGDFSGNVCYDAEEVYKYIINAKISPEKGMVYWSYEKDKPNEEY